MTRVAALQHIRAEHFVVIKLTFGQRRSKKASSRTSHYRLAAGRRGFRFVRYVSRALTTGGRMRNIDKAWFYGAMATAWLLALPGVSWANADVEKLTADPKNWAMQAGDEYNQRY